MGSQSRQVVSNSLQGLSLVIGPRVMKRVHRIRWKALAAVGMGIATLGGAWWAQRADSQEPFPFARSGQIHNGAQQQFPQGDFNSSSQSPANWTPQAAANSFQQWPSQSSQGEAPQDWPYRPAGGSSSSSIEPSHTRDRNPVMPSSGANSRGNRDGIPANDGNSAVIYQGNRPGTPAPLRTNEFGTEATTGYSGNYRPPRQEPPTNMTPGRPMSLPNAPVPAPRNPSAQRPAPANPTPSGDFTPPQQRVLTQKGNVTAAEWRGPDTKPVKQIKQVNFESYARGGDEEHPIPAEAFLVPYSQRAGLYPEHVETDISDGQLAEMPRNYVPWWNAVVNQGMRGGNETLAVNIEALVIAAIEYSPQVTALRIDPRIRETVIVEEDAAFDWTAFLETKYNKTNDPVGNKLTVTPTGGGRYNDDTVYSKGGLKKKFNQGAEVNVAERVGYQDNNSTFFTPQAQTTARLELNVTQPLLRGAGSMVNESRTVLAYLDRDISESELSAKLQDHIQAVYEAYWSLFRSRAVKLQKQRLLKSAEEIHNWLAARQGHDTTRAQVARALAAVASRRSEIVRAEMAIRNAESQLRLLVNSPALKEGVRTELLPAEFPVADAIDISLKGSVETALKKRPDVSQAIDRMKATSLRLGVAKNDLLPKLDLVLSTYTAQLRHANLGGAIGDQLSTGGPGYGIGFQFEMPLGNRAAKARHERREWEMAKALKEFEVAVETGMTEVEIAVREHETSYQEMLARFQAMLAAEVSASRAEQVFRETAGGDGVVVGVLLQDMLDAQERLASEEAEFVEAQVKYALAIVKLKKATGVLLSCDCAPISIKASDKVPTAPEVIPIPEIPVPVPEPVASKK